MRENNAYANKTWKYYYDNAGNITMRDEYAYTTGTLPAACQSFVFYDYSTGTWGDLLTSYNGTTINYDNIGNPTNWRNGASLTWNGRNLTSHSSSGGTLTYEYNSSGIRTRKHYVMPSGVPFTHDYVLDGTNIVKETVDGYVSYTMYFYYDETGVCGLEFNGETYYYLKNIQGDVVKILNASGQVVVEYTYDAWGKVLSTTGSLSGTVGFRNPFRYRGYYYDTETGFYSLQSRYYDPEIGRFINADVPEMMLLSDNILGTNLFAYCNNNPINYSDPSGHLAANVMKLVNGFSAATIFSSYMTGLYTAMTATLTKIGLWVTGILAPKIAAIFWWQPWLVAGIVVTAVAIVVGAVTIYLNSQMNKTVEEVLKTKKGSIKNAPLPPGGPNWKDLLKKTMKEIKDLAQKGVKGYKEIWKLLTDSRFNK